MLRRRPGLLAPCMLSRCDILAASHPSSRQLFPQLLLYHVGKDIVFKWTEAALHHCFMVFWFWAYRNSEKSDRAQHVVKVMARWELGNHVHGGVSHDINDWSGNDGELSLFSGFKDCRNDVRHLMLNSFRNLCIAHAIDARKSHNM